MKYHTHHSLWCLLLLTPYLFATGLQITPAVAVVETNKPLTLFMTGTDRPVNWSATKGQIQSAVGYQATYTAPSEAGVNYVLVTDDSGNSSTCKIIVVRAGTFVPENANWKVFTNRRTIAGLLLSEDKETLWIATSGGLEQREAKTQRLLRVYTTQQGLPHNFIQTLLEDAQGGLWLGTQSGLAYLQQDGQIKKWIEEDKILQSLTAGKSINSLAADGQGGLWITVQESGLVHFHADKPAELLTPDNSKLPDTWTYFPVPDGQGGVWVGTRQGLAHLFADQQWEVFNTTNSKLPDNRVVRLVSDGQGGLWIGTGENNLNLPVDSGGGLVHRDAQGNWEVFNTSNVPSFPGNVVWSLTADKQGGVWAGLTNNDFTTQAGGLVHRHPDGTWEVFTPSETTLPHPAVPAILADNREGIWIGTVNGLVYLHNDGTWDTLTSVKEDAPSNIVMAIDSDKNGGLWVAGGDVARLGEGGVAHLSAEGVWSTRYDELALSVSNDGQNGMWIGTFGALLHFPPSGKADFGFSIFDNPHTSKLPGNLAIVQTVVHDGAGGVWIAGNDQTAQQGGGIAHLLADHQTWELFDAESSELPDNRVTTLATDNQGGLWIGTLKGLAYLRADKTWEIFNIGNSQLPENSVMSLASDNQGGVWVGTMMSGIAHLKVDRTWQVFNQGNSELPSNGIIKTLLADDRNGVWAGILGIDMSQITADSSSTEAVNSLSFDQGGLVYLNPDGTTEIFNTQNSGLPDNQVIALKSDGRGGIWVGTAFGLAYLTLSKNAFLCNNANLDDAACDALLKGNRAAIIIAGGGNDNSNTLWETTESIINSIYHMLYERGFENDEIYYLSPKLSADFNGDGINDRAVDAPQPEGNLQVSDVQQALEWAKGRGKLDQPLYFFLVDHGAEDSNQKLYFKLSNTTTLEATQLRGFLDEYTAATSSSMVVVIDACWSGSLMEELSPSANRAIISSTTGSGKAYFYPPARQGFSRFLADSLSEGKSFKEAFEFASMQQTKILPRIAESSKQPIEQLGQEPKFSDGSGNNDWLQTLFVNGNFPRANPVSIKELVSSGSTNLAAGQKHLLKAQVNVTQGYLQHVWAILKPPHINLVLDKHGTPILDLPFLTLLPTVDAGIWETTWREATYNGDYELIFYAEDNQKNRASSSPVIVTVTGGIDLPSETNMEVTLIPQKDTYEVQERLTVQLAEQLNWGYDLYVMVTFPDGSFATLTDTNQFQPFNQAKKWTGKKSPNTPLTLIDMELVDLVGSYCIYGILSPAKEDFSAPETQASQVEVKWCAEVVNKTP